MNAAKYEALEAEAERKAAAARAARDRKPDKRGGAEEREEDVGPAGAYDPDAPLPEFSLAGAAHAWPGRLLRAVAAPLLLSCSHPAPQLATLPLRLHPPRPPPRQAQGAVAG